MKVKPVVCYKKPAYPCKADLRLHPKLLNKLPDRWAKNGAALTAFAMTLALCACAGGGPASGPDRITGGSTGQGETGGSEDGKDAGASVNSALAPVFIHGQGIASYGCIAVTQPYFLSEEEAFEIIKSEAKHYGGISFANDKTVTIKDAELPESLLYSDGSGTKYTSRKADLDLDGADRERGIAFEFISRNDVYDWRKENEKSLSTASTYDMQGTAERLRDGLVSCEPDMAMGIFYDPCNDIDMQGVYEAIAEAEKDGQTFDLEAARAEKETEARTKSEQELRAQVRDFLDWLKGQGVI